MTGQEGMIKAKREAAASARRLSTRFTSEQDRNRILAFAAELDAQAHALARRESAPSTPAVTQMQMQVQQGPATKDEEEPKA